MGCPQWLFQDSHTIGGLEVVDSMASCVESRRHVITSVYTCMARLSDDTCSLLIDVGVVMACKGSTSMKRRFITSSAIVQKKFAFRFRADFCV